MNSELFRDRSRSQVMQFSSFEHGVITVLAMAAMLIFWIWVTG